MKVPEGWKRVALKEVVRLYKGITYKSEDYCEEGEGYIFINLKCIAKSGGFKPEGIKYIKGKILEFQRLSPDDLLIANTDLTRDGNIIGCPVLVPKFDSCSEVTMSMDLSKLVVNPERIDKFFLYYILMTPLARKFMKDRSRGSTVLHLQTSLVPSFTFDMPNRIEEQSKISEILSIVDEAIDKTEALIQKYQHIKQGLMQDLLTKGIDEKGNIRGEKMHKFKDSPLGRVPEEWEVANLGSKSYVKGGKRLPPGHNFAGYETKFPYIRVLDFYNYSVRLTGLEFLLPKTQRIISRYTISKNDVYISIAGTIGIVGTIPEVLDGANLTENAAKLTNIQGINQKFLAYFLDSHASKKQIAALIGTTTQPKLAFEKIEKIIIVIPCKDEQERIINRLDIIMTMIEKEQAYKQKLLAIKHGLMEDLLTGTVRVNHLLKNN